MSDLASGACCLAAGLAIGLLLTATSARRVSRAASWASIAVLLAAVAALFALRAAPWISLGFAFTTLLGALLEFGEISRHHRVLRRLGFWQRIAFIVRRPAIIGSLGPELGSRQGASAGSHESSRGPEALSAGRAQRAFRNRR